MEIYKLEIKDDSFQSQDGWLLDAELRRKWNVDSLSVQDRSARSHYGALTTVLKSYEKSIIP